MEKRGRPLFSKSRTAGSADIDELGHVNNAVYVRWVQEIATAHWHAAARPDDRERFLWVVTRHEIDYRKPILPGETVELKTWVGEPKGARFDRFVEITGADGKIRVFARTVWAMLDRRTRAPARITEEIARPFLRA